MNKYFIGGALFACGASVGFGIGHMFSERGSYSPSQNANADGDKSKRISEASTDRADILRRRCQVESNDGSLASKNQQKPVAEGRTLVDRMEIDTSDLEVITTESGSLTDTFCSIVGLTAKERHQVETILSECSGQMKNLQYTSIIPTDEFGMKFRLPSLSGKGEKINDKFISELRSVLDGGTFDRFMTHGTHQILPYLDYFGRYGYNIHFQEEDGEMMMDVIPETNNSGTNSADGPPPRRFRANQIPDNYKYLFKINE